MVGKGCTLSGFKSIVANCHFPCVGAGSLAEERKASLHAAPFTTEKYGSGATSAAGFSGVKGWTSSPLSPFQPPPPPSLRETAAGERALLEHERRHEQQQLQALGPILSSEDDGIPDKAATASTIHTVSLANSPGLCKVGLTPTNNNSNSIKERLFRSNSNGGRFFLNPPPEPGQVERRIPTQVREARGGRGG